MEGHITAINTARGDYRHPNSWLVRVGGKWYRMKLDNQVGGPNDKSSVLFDDRKLALVMTAAARGLIVELEVVKNSAEPQVIKSLEVKFKP